MLSYKVKVGLPIEFDGVTPYSLEHTQSLGDVFFSWIDLHIIFLEILIKARVHPHNSS
jgi:hypothetical protein